MKSWLIPDEMYKAKRNLEKYNVFLLKNLTLYVAANCDYDFIKFLTKFLLVVFDFKKKSVFLRIDYDYSSVKHFHVLPQRRIIFTNFHKNVNVPHFIPKMYQNSRNSLSSVIRHNLNDNISNHSECVTLVSP